MAGDTDDARPGRAPGLILGLLSIGFGVASVTPVFGLAASVGGLACGVVGLRRAAAANYNLGIASAIIGLVLSAVVPAIMLFGALVIGGLLALFMAGARPG